MSHDFTSASSTLNDLDTLGLGFSYGASAQYGAPEVTPAEVGTSSVVNFSGKIVDVDTVKGLVTLEGPEGRRVTFVVRNPDNLKAAKVGEPFSASYYVKKYLHILPDIQDGNCTAGEEHRSQRED